MGSEDYIAEVRSQKSPSKTPLGQGFNSDLSPDVGNPIFSQMATKSIGFHPVKILFFDLFGNGARSEFKRQVLS
ncbi:MAG TPA: hypothetical protein DCF68_16080 [Cyanothece sp. UBA12306]|nr:hypothetical protein [Cyanothece sp. UBA12306]